MRQSFSLPKVRETKHLGRKRKKEAGAKVGMSKGLEDGKK